MRDPRGKVWLVGAGPGDPELLTLKAVRALGAADVILIDDLVDRAILAHTKPGARVVSVGKRGGCRSTPQVFIDHLLLREARAGHTVVRLKGGDPFVFGRGGEEVAMLRAAGIDVEVVNGITAGLAAPAAAGIPVTHRGLAHGVALVTGHAAESDGDDDEPNWTALAQSGLTLVIYMGLARAAAIRKKLLAAGMRASMPVTVIANATRSNQQSIGATLADFPRAIDSAGLASPAIIVVGEVAALATISSADELQSGGNVGEAYLIPNRSIR